MSPFSISDIALSLWAYITSTLSKANMRPFKKVEVLAWVDDDEVGG